MSGASMGMQPRKSSLCEKNFEETGGPPISGKLEPYNHLVAHFGPKWTKELLRGTVDYSYEPFAI